MTHLVNDPRTFAADVLTGFARAHADRVREVPGGVVRVAPAPPGKVAVVLGGGSGHYPAFAGWVGEGMADGVVCGNIFASPSADQAVTVVRAADRGAGVLLGFGNYAGDQLQFGQAAKELRADGIDVRMVTVTDDLASATEPEQRRGIAGDLIVFKIAGAAAAAGADLDDVERVATRANARTRTIGIALAGCTLPGQDEPLFTIPAGRIALGLGIHGEPGLSTEDLGSASEVADDLVARILAEAPEDADRVAVLVNGLGATTHEELFAVYGRVADRLTAAGLVIVAPEVGEQVTSLDMAGLSLTATFLDPELERYWTAPADTPAFRRGRPGPLRADPAPAAHPAVATLTPASSATAVAPGTEDSRRATEQVLRTAAAIAVALTEHEEELGRLDAVAGDGDHGQGMVLGIGGAVRAAEQAHLAGAGLGDVLDAAGRAWSNAAGGTSGALWGAALRAAGAEVGNERAPDGAGLARAVDRAVTAAADLGGAREGDKTVIDAAVPFAAHLRSAVGQGSAVPAAWASAANAAEEAARGTAALTARLGRARTHGERARGHADPGAISFALVVGTVAQSSTVSAEES
ncbi:dihydroxyacetone kinase family protein [Occultella aeris]|uniref:PTS-dependent dihydroxyacetone kinase, dihydroxyacetone-binding subunit DhaK n=1 Tax=Occultella aeris TaxID=2761496 RepID=A0A7M4DGX4_9MICO|nr:dihydroxyacetone kinase family protein [Occultella aeris]VZO36167.1 PTS-dependent dihydroxyacetone kinase, dihydroxyacetone-binding subunit DhaK [Occultella aeris]